MHPDQLKAARIEKGNQLKKQREEKKITKTLLAQISGLSRSTIYLIESGNASWSIDTEIIYVTSVSNYRK